MRYFHGTFISQRGMRVSIKSIHQSLHHIKGFLLPRTSNIVSKLTKVHVVEKKTGDTSIPLWVLIAKSFPYIFHQIIQSEFWDVRHKFPPVTQRSKIHKIRWSSRWKRRCEIWISRSSHDSCTWCSNEKFWDLYSKQNHELDNLSPRFIPYDIKFCTTRSAPPKPMS